MNKVTRKHKKNWLTITAFAFLCLPRVGRLTCFSGSRDRLTRYWISVFCRWELRSLFCVIFAEKSIANKLPPLRKSTENLNVLLNDFVLGSPYFNSPKTIDNPCYISSDLSSRSQWFCKCLRTCWQRNNGSFNWVFIVRKAHLSVKPFMEGFIKFDSRS